MNHADLKNYAPQARRDFIQAVTDRAAFYGVTAAKIEPVTEKGDVAIIAGHAFPVSVVAKRKKLVDRINRDGFNQTMEALAYTWFNRLVAIRFMELHGYLEHGYRVLSHPDPANTIPEALELAEHVDLPGLRKEKVIDLKLDVNKESELYRILLLAQCHALHSAMPFLFEGIDDETELVLPENLLHSDSLIRKLVAASAPEDWQEVEVLGWLYQFYISERKAKVMARDGAVPPEDIPARTQLFTPHWIVRYLVENSLGRLWLLNHPGSRLREHMPYYIEGEAETNFLKIIKPEEIRLLDPACGSGHMLTYAFELLFRIYEEEGYVPDEIPALILEHNLYGLEICPRAAQLANLALVFKARERSRRFIQPGNLVQPRILALQNVHFDDRELTDYVAALDLGDFFNAPMLELLHQFKETMTFGSLIQPCINESGIGYARRAIDTKDLGSQLFLRETHSKVSRILDQAEMLCQRYHVVVTNPPYMGGRQMNSDLKKFAEDQYHISKADLFAMFMDRGFTLALSNGIVAMVTMQSWMFLSSFEDLRTTLLSTKTLLSMAHLGPRAFDTIGGEVVQATSFVAANCLLPHAPATFLRLTDGRSESEKAEQFVTALTSSARTCIFHVSAQEFTTIPGSPLAYWASERLRAAFGKRGPLSATAPSRPGLQTGDNPSFVRLWFEVDYHNIGSGFESRADAAASGLKWFPYNKGGAFRRWYGNCEFVLDWLNDGERIKRRKADDLASGKITANNSKCWNQGYYFRPSTSWSKVSGSDFAARFYPAGFVFDIAGCSVFFDSAETSCFATGFLNSKVTKALVGTLSETINFEAGNIAKLPFPNDMDNGSQSYIPRQLIELSKRDWDSFETSWNFTDHPLLRPGIKCPTLEASWLGWKSDCDAALNRMKQLETENNRLFIDAYDLQDELTAEVSEDQITLARADQRKDMAAILSYAVGCIMGRYSLEKHGLILADAGSTLEQYLSIVGVPLNQLAVVPDEDGIIPMLDGDWFKGDIVARVHAFLRATFDEATLEASLRFIEESLGKDLRKYFLTDFFKDHLQTYKKRPIYWLFSSGKERAFQALVYLHRYHEGTLSRMRTEYVIPLQGKIASRIDQLADDIQKVTSTSHRKKMQKEQDILLKQRTELQTFDEKLRHYADQRIHLDLDDGVKVNYGKFGDLLAEVKAVTGGSDE
jgi:hypothetical protein